MTGERRLRVLITTSTFPVRPDDGTPRFILDLALALSEHADTMVLAPSVLGSAERERFGQVDVRRFTYFRPSAYQRLAMGDGIPDNLRRSWLARLQVPSFLAAEIRATRRLIAEKQIDVVNAHWLVPQALAAAVAVGSRGQPPIVAHAHGGDAHLLRDLPLGRRVAELILRRTRVLLASGSRVRDILNELMGRDVGAHLQPMGVDLSFFRGGADSVPCPPERALDERFPAGYLLFSGRMIEIKGAIHLIRALPRVRKAYPELALVLIGDGPERPRLEREAAALGLEGAVSFLGRLSHREVAPYVRGCRAAVVPSIVDSTNRSEGMPTVILEAMAAGARVVACATGGVPDVVRHGENGWLCRPADPPDLALKILDALADGEPSPVVRAAQETANAAGWSQVALAYMREFEAAVREGPLQ